MAPDIKTKLLTLIKEIEDISRKEEISIRIKVWPYFTSTTEVTVSRFSDKNYRNKELHNGVILEEITIKDPIYE